MLKNIRKYALITATISVIFPVIHFNLVNLNLMLFNFGTKGLIVALVICLLAMHEHILPNKILNKSNYISLVLTCIDLILVISALLVTMSKLKKINSLPILSFISTFNKTDFSLSWGWIPLILGLVIAIICNALIIHQEKNIIK